MTTKEHSTRETGACVCDCQSCRVKPEGQSAQFLCQVEVSLYRRFFGRLYYENAAGKPRDDRI